MTNTDAVKIMEHMQDFIDLTLEERNALNYALDILNRYTYALNTMNKRLMEDFYTEIEEDDVLRDCIELLAEGEDD